MNTLTDNRSCRGLSKSALQLIAAAAMVIDHTSVFIGDLYLYYLMRFIGRTTIIIMCYFIAEGYHKTRDLDKYLLRMGLFAAVAQIPFYLYSHPDIPSDFMSFITGNLFSRNVIFTLFTGLALISILHSRYSPILKILALAAAFHITRNSDWRMYALLWILCFDIFYGSKKKQLIAASVILLMRCVDIGYGIFSESISAGYLTVGDLLQMAVTFGGFIAIPLIALYNGSRGRRTRFGFYIFYPAHLLIIAAAEFIILHI